MHYPLIQFVLRRLLRLARAQHLRLPSAFLLGVFLCSTPLAFLSCGGAELLEGTAHAQLVLSKSEKVILEDLGFANHTIPEPLAALSLQGQRITVPVKAYSSENAVRAVFGFYGSLSTMDQATGRGGFINVQADVAYSEKDQLYQVTFPVGTFLEIAALRRKKLASQAYFPILWPRYVMRPLVNASPVAVKRAAWQLLKSRLFGKARDPEDFPSMAKDILIYHDLLMVELADFAEHKLPLLDPNQQMLVCKEIPCDRIDDQTTNMAKFPNDPKSHAMLPEPPEHVWKPLLSAEDLPPLIEDVKKLMTAPGFPTPAVPEEKLAKLANLWNQFEPDEKRLLASNLSPGLDADELEQALLLHVGLKGRIAQMYQRSDDEAEAEDVAFERYLQEVFEGENLREVKTMTREQRCEKAEQLGDRVSAAMMKWSVTHPTTFFKGMFQLLNPMHHYRAQEQAKAAQEDPGALPSEKRGYLIRRGKGWGDLACSVAAWGSVPLALINPGAGAKLLKGSITASFVSNLATAPMEAYYFKQAACDRSDPYRFKNAVLELGASKSAYQMTGGIMAIVLLLRRVARIPRVRAYLVQVSRALKSFPVSRWLSVRPRIVAAVRNRFRIDLDVALQRAQLQIQQTVTMLQQAPTGRALLRLAAAGNVLARELIGLPEKKYAQALKQVEQFPRYAKGWDQVSATLRRRMGQLSERLGTWKKQFLGRLEEQVVVIEQAQDAGAGEAALGKMTADFSDAGTFEQTLRGEAEQLRQELAATAEMLEGDRGPSIRTKAGEGLLAENAGMSLKRYRGWLVEKARQLWSKQGSERQAELNGLLDRAVAGSEAGEVVGLVGFLEEALRLPAGKAMARIERVLAEASRLQEGLKRGGGGDPVVRVRGEKAEVVERGDWSLPESLKKQEQLLGTGTDGRPLDLRGQVVAGGGTGKPGEIVASAGGGKPAGATEVGTMRPAGGPASGPEAPVRAAEPPRERLPIPPAPATALDIAQTLQAIEAEAAKAPALSEKGPAVGSPVEVEVPRLPKDGEIIDLAARLNERELAGKLSKAGDIILTEPEGNTLTMKAQPDPAGPPGSRLWKRSEQPSVPFVKGEIIWVEENAFMKKEARQYQAGATQAQSSVASKKSVVPQINYVRPNGTVGTVRFDGLDGRTLIDRKLSVYRTLKSQKQILRQSEALSQNGLRARWETKDLIECNGARSLLKKLGITNIDVEVVPYE